MKRDEWLAQFAREAGVDQPDEERADSLLKLAAIAAHSSERTAAPLACWIAGRSQRSLDELLEAARQVE